MEDRWLSKFIHREGRPPTMRELEDSMNPSNSADRCRQEGWQVGDVLEGSEGYGPVRVRITSIGETEVRGKCIEQSSVEISASEGIWSFLHHSWHKIDPQNP